MGVFQVETYFKRWFTRHMLGKKLPKLPKRVKVQDWMLIIVKIAGGLGACLVIGYLNFLVINGWFGGQGPANLGSIEVSYVSMGRFLVDFGLKTWAPFWYFGFPFHLFYTPLLPFLEFLLSKTAGFHLWEAYRWITGWAYIAGPISVFFLGWVLSKRWLGGFLSGMLYSVAPTLFYFILPATRDSVHGEVAADRFSYDFWDPRRFTVLVRWGEGPHTLSLVFLPLAAGLFLVSLRKQKFWVLVTASLFLTLAALTNALGFMGSLLLCLVIAFVGIAQNPSRRIQISLWTVMLAAIGIGLAGFWYNLDFILNFFAEGGGAANIYLSMFPWGWLAIGLAVGILFFLSGRVIKDWGFAAALIWFLGLFFVVYYYYYSAPAELSGQRIELLPQALRYSIQVDMAFSVLAGVTVASLLKWIGKRFLLVEQLLTVFIASAVLYAFIYIQPFLSVSYNVSDNAVDLSQTREQVIAKLLEKNAHPKEGERVFVPGNYGFYLNWFTDVWQQRGGLFQAATHPWPDHIHYQMANGDDAELAWYWLKAMNVKYLVIPTAESAELYREIKNPERFEELDKVYENHGDVIYRGPLIRPSVAKAVSREEMLGLATPTKADDKEALRNYVSWVEESAQNEASFEMIDHDNYKLRGKLDEGEILLVQMTADDGWKAWQIIDGKEESIRTGKDPLGFLLLFPDAGDFEINLVHRRTFKIWLGYLTTLFTLIFVVWYQLARRKFAEKIEKYNQEKGKVGKKSNRGGKE